MQRRWWSLLLCFASLSVAEPAFACSCGRREVEVVPNERLEAPLNARILVFLYADELHRHDPDLARNRAPDADELARIDEVTFLVRRLGRRPLDVERRSFGAGDVRVLELRPREPLEPWRSYEVVAVFPSRQTRVLETFMSGDTPDHSAPQDTRLESARYNQQLRMSGECNTGEPGIRLQTRVPHEATGDYVSIPFTYEVWSATAGQTIDYDRPPETIVRDGGETFMLGHANRCNPRNFVLPDRATRLRLGLRVVDTAGNPGPVHEVVFDLPEPVPPADLRPDRAHKLPDPTIFDIAGDVMAEAGDAMGR